MSSTCFEQPSFYPLEDLYMLFYGISFIGPYKQSGQRQGVLDQYEYQTRFPDIDQTAYRDAWKNTINRHVVRIFLRMKA